jgi:hypothetical protein
VTRHPVPALDALRDGLHALVRERVANLVEEHRLRLPELAPLTELADPAAWFAVPGWYGGFSYRLDRTTLVVESWSRVVGGSGRRHVIDEHGTRLVDQGFV